MRHCAWYAVLNSPAFDQLVYKPERLPWIDDVLYEKAPAFITGQSGRVPHVSFKVHPRHATRRNFEALGASIITNYET